MNKLIWALAALLLCCSVSISAANRKIAYISQRDGYYEINYSGTSKVEKVSTGVGKLAAYSDTHYILYKDGYYMVMNSEKKKLSTLSASKIGSIIAVTDNTIIAERQGWIIQWSFSGEKVSEKRKR